LLFLALKIIASTAIKGLTSDDRLWFDGSSLQPKRYMTAEEQERINKLEDRVTELETQLEIFRIQETFTVIFEGLNKLSDRVKKLEENEEAH
jgi:hypothetical protein